MRMDAEIRTVFYVVTGIVLAVDFILKTVIVFFYFFRFNFEG
jgi:hypothetical protein